MTKYDAVIISGGGLQPDGMLNPPVVARLDRALAVQGETQFFITASGGTVHKPPPLNPQGYPLFESFVAADYLIERGIETGRILTEISSYDTIGNAYFTKVIHAQPCSLNKLLVITSAFHMPRTEAVFRWVYGLDKDTSYTLTFEATPDVGVEPEILALREAREQQSLENVKRQREQYTTTVAFHQFMFTEHKAYAAGLKNDQAGGDILATY